ncbi:MAG: aminotransferase class I/II-fold pyridoxal phosphate-dependent enzyme [Deltaproteobacteria bacterium]|nr:aminotransferase class I/II-fold pyridoxal phosphate-dependent enzyme [Deltaproteobacteria bacterium]
MRLIDLVSDTVTLPTKAMKQAMVDAALGDEQRGEDPTTAHLEERVAALLGAERALLLPSATMGNQIALALHAGAGDEVVAHRTSHVVHYEGGGAATTARAQVYGVDGPRGIFTADDIVAAVRDDDPHHPRTRAVVVENTSNAGGGAVWPVATFDAVVAAAAARGLAVHVDGARLWNAHVASGLPLARVVRGATTVQVCFSKGLGCPMGAVLALPSSLWPRARRLKQALGGALRQSGLLAGAMLHALDHHVERLADDHRRARALAAGFAAVDGVDVEPVETNLVFFRVPGRDAGAVQAALQARGVRVGVVGRTVSSGPARLRACLHLDIEDDDVARATAALAAAVVATPVVSGAS